MVIADKKTVVTVRHPDFTADPRVASTYRDYIAASLASTIAAAREHGESAAVINWFAQFSVTVDTETGQ